MKKQAKEVRVAVPVTPTATAGPVVVSAPAVTPAGCAECGRLRARILELETRLGGKKEWRREYMQRYRASKKVPTEKE